MDVNTLEWAVLIGVGALPLWKVGPLRLLLGLLLLVLGVMLEAAQGTSNDGNLERRG